MGVVAGVASRELFRQRSRWELMRSWGSWTPHTGQDTGRDTERERNLFTGTSFGGGLIAGVQIRGSSKHLTGVHRFQ